MTIHKHLMNDDDRAELAKAGEMASEGASLRRRVMARLRQRALRAKASCPDCGRPDGVHAFRCPANRPAEEGARGAGEMSR